MRAGFENTLGRHLSGLSGEVLAVQKMGLGVVFDLPRQYPATGAMMGGFELVVEAIDDASDGSAMPVRGASPENESDPQHAAAYSAAEASASAETNGQASGEAHGLFFGQASLEALVEGYKYSFGA